MSKNMSAAKTSDAYLQEMAQMADELTPAGRFLAGTLWGIERYGEPYAENPAPLHTTMAWQLQTDPVLCDALVDAIMKVRGSDA